MKTLANSSDKEELLRRLKTVRPDSPRRWGKMTPHQMICHLNDAYLAYVGEKKVTPAPAWFPRTIVRVVAVWTPLPWARGFPTAPEVDQLIGGTPPVEFERDVRELEMMIERYSKLLSDYPWPAHPAFGRMSLASWMRLGYLHTNHHLRQFSA